MIPKTKPKKPRAPIEKQHYWLQIDFQVRADTLESALARAAKLFRKTYRSKLKLSDNLVYMGAYGARCSGGLAPKRPRTMHPTVSLSKGLPIVPGVTLQELDADDAAKRSKKKYQMTTTITTEGTNVILSEPHVVSEPKPTSAGREGKPTKRRGLAGLMAR